MTAPTPDPGALLDRLEEGRKAAPWQRCGCLAGLGHIPSVSDCHQAGLCQMRENERARESALIRAARDGLALRDAVLALAEELEGESATAMTRADVARERDDRVLYTTNVRHARVAHQAAASLRAVVADATGEA